MARLQGPLGAPEFTLVRENLLKKGLSAGTAVATSGVSLLASRIHDRAGSKTDPCELPTRFAPVPAGQP